jgi:hypothetical protein
VLLRVSVDGVGDKITEFGAGAKLYWYRDNTSAAGTFTDATGNVTLVATQSQYEIVDSTGAVGHFYRTRVGNTGGTVFDTYGNVFQAGALSSYASVDDLREIVGVPDNSRDNLLSDLLLRCTVSITNALGWDFFRHPQVTGTEVRLYDAGDYVQGSGGGQGNSLYNIYEQQGIQPVPAPTVRVAFRTNQNLISLASTEFFLRGQFEVGGPFHRLAVTDLPTSVPYFGRGFGTVEVTAAFGYASVPADIEQATLAWASDLYRLGPGGGIPSTAMGATEGGFGSFVGGMPAFTYGVVHGYQERHGIWVG